MEVMEAATQAEQKFHEVMAERDECANGFDLPEAMLLGVTVHGDDVRITPEVAKGGDIYQLLDSRKAKDATRSFDYVALVTCGWAAPIDPDTGETEGGDSPAQSTQRRRVRLFIVANADSVANVLRFADEADEPIADAGEATGPLAEAVQALFW